MSSNDFHYWSRVMAAMGPNKVRRHAEIFHNFTCKVTLSSFFPTLPQQLSLSRNIKRFPLSIRVTVATGPKKEEAWKSMWSFLTGSTGVLQNDGLIIQPPVLSLLEVCRPGSGEHGNGSPNCNLCVAYNNLSGKTPGMTAQFATFDESGYEGNPFLCGFPLPRKCNAAVSPSPLPRTSANVNEQDNNFMDMDAFYVSFLGSYIMMLLGIAAILWINPYWRRAWFYLIQEGTNSCYFFLVDNIPVPYQFKVLQPCV